MAVAGTGARLTAEQFFRNYPDDDKRYELIDGELREMTTPNIRHQDIQGLLFLLLHAAVIPHGGRVWTGVGVAVAQDRFQVPDLTVLTRPLKQTNLEYGLESPPDLVVEILSRGTARYDRTEKAARYAAFGVPELWLASPEAETIEVLTLSEGRYILHGRFGLDEPVSSVVLPGLSFPASAAFTR